MPKNKNTWLIGMPKGPVGPFVWQVWVNGSKKPVRVVAFDLEHIKDQLEGKTGCQSKEDAGREDIHENTDTFRP